jgi:ATP-dependent RNA helicase HrpB
VLAPSNRPVQVTENVAVFWRETYPKLKQQLQRKYPKHKGGERVRNLSELTEGWQTNI